jgi:hypothetical protein
MRNATQLMKPLRITVLFILICLLGSTVTSCTARRYELRSDNGRHLGWYKQKKHHHTVYVIEKENHKKSHPETRGSKKAKKR